MSRNGVPIRLTDKQWRHISEEHAELSMRMQDLLDTSRRRMQFSGDMLASFLHFAK